jgi:LysM repeat protein
MSKGRHAKPANKTAKRIAVGATFLAGGSLVTVTSASAATDAQWEAVAIPEAGGDWTIDHSGDGLSVGGLQFQNPSWQDALAYLRKQGIDTSGFPPSLYQGMPNVPSKAQQMLAGEALLHLQGPGAWANGNGSGLGASMFDGGSIPETVAQSGLLKGTRFDSTPEPTPEPDPAPVKSKSHGHDSKYTVVRGDWLAKIAARYHVKGGWEALYAANRAAVGSNPNLIFPGLKLVLPGAAATPTEKPAPKPKTADYVSPCEGTLTQSFGNPGAFYGLGYHTGIDISAPYGTPVVSAAAGTVVSINASGSPYGTHVVVKHADGNYTLYAHLSSKLVVLGQSVAAGQSVGTVGSSGTSSGPHLHFEVRKDPTQYAGWVFLNPVGWLRGHGVTI